jgi:hypothetical protein
MIASTPWGIHPSTRTRKRITPYDICFSGFSALNAYILSSLMVTDSTLWDHSSVKIKSQFVFCPWLKTEIRHHPQDAGILKNTMTGNKIGILCTGL